MVKHMGPVHGGIWVLLNACTSPIVEVVIGNVRISLANQPKQIQQFGSPIVMPRIEVRVIASLLTKEQGKAHPIDLRGQDVNSLFFQGGSN